MLITLKKVAGIEEINGLGLIAQHVKPLLN